MIPDQYPNYYNVLEIYSVCFDSLDIKMCFSYPSSIVITRDYCIRFQAINSQSAKFLNIHLDMEWVDL